MNLFGPHPAWSPWVTLGGVALMIGLLSLTRVGADLIAFGVLTLLLTLGVLPPAEAVEGFANPGLLTIAALFVVSTGIRETGALAGLVERVLGRPRSAFAARARLVGPTALLSAFVYDVPLVAILLPLVTDWAKRIGVSPSRLLIPLSYAAALGGVCTLIGTSTNALVNGMLLSLAHHPGLGFFDTAWVGVPCALAGLAYLLLAGGRLLPDRSPPFAPQADARQYVVEMLIEAGSPLVGRSVEKAGLRHLPGLFLVEIDREGQVLPAVSSAERLRADDRLVFAGVVESVVDLQKIRGLKPANDQVFQLDAPRSQRCLIEAVVSNSCPLIGLTIREGRFRNVYQAAVIALARNGERVHKKLGDIVLQAGDTLLLEAPLWFEERHRNSRDFFLVSRVEGFVPPRHERGWVATAVLAGMVAAAGLGWLDMLSAALLAAGLMVLTGCCSGSQARRSVDVRVLLLIGASLGIGRAVVDSGLAGGIARLVIGAAGTSPWVSLALVYALTVLLTEILSHHASVVLVFPVALSTAQALGVSLMPFAMAVLLAGSFVFATPLGSQPNLIVFGPGGYRFTDYLRLGGPLNFVTGAVAVALTPVVWPF